MKNDKMTRQGDVLTVRRDDIDLATLRKKGQQEAKDNCVLAEGEATGHAHRVSQEGVSLHMMDGLRFLHVPKSAGAVAVRHEEHAGVVLEPGVHEIRRQREYDAGEARRVAD